MVVQQDTIAKCMALLTLLINLQQDPKTFLDHVMDTFDETLRMIPHVREHLKCVHEGETDRCVRDGNSTSKVITCKLLIDGLFEPQEQVTKDINTHMANIEKEIETT